MRSMEHFVLFFIVHLCVVWKIESCPADVAGDYSRLGWLELKVTLSKLFFKYDFELLSTDVDWQRDARMHLLWKRPRVVVLVTRRD